VLAHRRDDAVQARRGVGRGVGDEPAESQALANAKTGE
jgi:hypothetical protein